MNQITAARDCPARLHCGTEFGRNYGVMPE
jgi:hypothetical protein